MSLVPSIQSTTLTDRVVRMHPSPFVPGSDVIIASSQSDSGSTPTSRLRKGNVVVLVTATGKFVAANDATGDRNTQAHVTASETADADWQSKTITVNLNGIDIVTVALAGTDDTDAEVVTALNGNAIFAANCIASASGSRVHIKSLATGSGVALAVTSNLATAFGASGQTGFGSDADYRVTEDFCDLVNESGAAADAIVSTSLVGAYDESNLINLTGEARVVLSRRGSIFA